MIGQTLAVKYEILAQVSDGPIFVMFAARDRLSGRNLGIRQVKMPFNAEADFINTLVELLPNLQISHPNVESLYEIVEDSGQHYLISELPKGSLLTERIKRFAPFTVPVSLATVIGVVEALDAIHTRGIAHGDVGPHNIIAMHDGSAKLQLAGVWKAYSSSRTAGVAVLSQMAPYLAPEVCTGQKPSPQSDLYSVGVVLFELLTGRVPHLGETPTATTVRHLTSPVPSLRGINASVPAAVEQVVNKLLAKDPESRYQSARDLLSELRTILDQLRFGRVPTAKSPEVGQPVVVEPAQPIRTPSKKAELAPKRTDDEAVKERKKQRKERDVPVWVQAILAVFVLSAVGAVVAFFAYIAQKPREVKVPNLKGVLTKTAMDQVKQLKLNLRVAGKESNERMEIGKILRTSPAAGETIREGGTITVIESSGTRLVKVPDLKGMTADEARIALEAENLRLDGKPSRIVDYDDAEGSIVKQVPDPGETVVRTSKVQIWIAATNEAPTGSLPGENGEPTDNPAHSFSLDYKIKDVKWSVTVRVEFEDRNGIKTVLERDCEPGEHITARQIGYGDKATFRIFYDGELKDTIEVQPGVKSSN
ncbi:MAG: PASTA domain-containing protein [Armatimonadetes bacterium]|nr:PASTA domain-containing protein [Armatimonadota bacterium]MBS1703370.1 PASTA domain-containing protein [Armatimonadota bacterium]